MSVFREWLQIFAVYIFFIFLPTEQRAKMANNLYQEFSDIGRIIIVHNAKINFKPLKAIHAISCVNFE